EAQARPATTSARPRRIGAIEALEDLLSVLDGDARATVAHLENDHRAVVLRRRGALKGPATLRTLRAGEDADGDLARRPRRRVGGDVPDEIRDHLPQRSDVPEHDA